jgi:hypothetical protein
MSADISILSQLAVNLSRYVRSAAKDPARLDVLNRFFNSVEWEDLIDPDSSLSRILWSIRNILYLHESYGDRVDVDHQRASLLDLADRLDEVNRDQTRESLTRKAVV